MACMVYLWDYLLTFGMEVDLVWKSKWNFMKGLYIFQRYLPFTDIIWLVLSCLSYFFPSSYTELFCRESRGNIKGGRVSEGILH